MMHPAPPVVADGKTVTQLLPLDVCIPLVRDAMMALSAGASRQTLRSMIGLGEGRVFGIMPGALSVDGYFGAKLVSVFRDQVSGRTAHRGVVCLFEPGQGHTVCIADAEEITLIRTAAATAAATNALARPDSRILAILGAGRQAIAHAAALRQIRPLERIVLWGRTLERARAAGEQITAETGVPVDIAADAAAAVHNADIVCTVTAAAKPILQGEWVPKGAHVNLVGASGPSAAEADNGLVRRARYFVESRASALAQAGEFLNAKNAGLIDDSHIVAEIGEVFLGRHAGRTDPEEVTVYKSLGHVVQDLAAAAHVYGRLRAE